MNTILLLIFWFVLTTLFVGGIALFKTKWLYTVRFIGTAMFLCLLGVAYILWLDVREQWVLVLGIGASFLGLFSILSWPKTQPRLMKILKLNW
jgi:hypothetical protein